MKRTHSSAPRVLVFLTLFSVVLLPALVSGQRAERVVKPNYRQAKQYSTQYLRQFLYDTSVDPNWIGESDVFWYSFRNSTGSHYYRVDPAKGTKEPLFDHVNLGSQLSEMTKKPLDPSQLSLSRMEMNKEGTEFKFVVDRKQFSYNLESQELKELGDAPAQQAGRRGRRGQTLTRQQLERLREQQGGRQGRGQNDPNSHRSFSPDRKSYVFAKGHDLYFVEIPKNYKAPEEEKKEDEKSDGEKSDEEKDGQNSDDGDGKGETSDEKQTEKKDETDKDVESTEGKDQQDEKSETDQEKTQQKQKDGQKKDQEKKDEEQDDDNEDEEKKDEEKKDQDEESGEESSADEEEDDSIPIPKIGPELDKKAVRLSTDGEDDYSFAGRRGGARGGRGGNQQSDPIEEDQKTRPSVSWSEDSKSFYVSRRDSRGVKDLWVINSLGDPRPTLETYGYPMPGEEDIRTSELYYYHLGTKKKDRKLTRVEPKWTDEGYTNIDFGRTGDELRFLRRDRLLRNIEFCSLDLPSGEVKCLLAEGFENAHIAPKSMRYLEDTDEMIWWSERSGWGHYYLYGRDGTFKNAITSGEFLASRIVEIDEKNRLLYFTGSGREADENVYQTHLYSVRLDGTGLKLMDPGNASHSSTLSPSKQYLVDNCSRVDMRPISILRNADGKEIMRLEEADLSRLDKVGWQIPETFIVKAADGVTNLYGNLWKPFDFDEKKKYPIIAHVYPGPQTEGTRHTFSATVGEQQLAQLGFIVVQVGHRGGTPGRGKAYGSFGYFNLRDYGLADKKAAIEQLAQRFPYIDIDRVGIYGHSGGGFMTAAALLREPYNDFFKVGVSTAGNHDNNIYNNSWSERYHGLRVVEVEEEQAGRRGARRGGRGAGREQTQQETGDTGAFSVEASDYFYEYEMLNDHDQADLDSWDPETWWNNPLTSYQQDQQQTQQDQNQGQRGRRGRRGRGQRQEQTQQDQEQKEDVKEQDQEKKDEEEKDEEDKDEEEKDEDEKDEEEDGEKKAKKTRFEIDVPSNVDLAGNLKGHLFLIHGELDNNVHPANTLRLVDALIKANKRFDMLYLPATRHGFGQYQPYVTQRMYEYFAEHLLDDYQSAADISEKEVDER